MYICANPKMRVFRKYVDFCFGKRIFPGTDKTNMTEAGQHEY